MKKIIVTSFLLISLIIISTLNTVNAQLNVPHGWKDDGGTNPIYPVANDYSVDKQICIGTNTANPNVSLTIVGSQTVTGNVAIGTSTTKNDAVLNVVGSVTVSQGIKFGDNTTLTSVSGIVTTTAIQDIAHGGTAGTTAASALVNLGAVSTTAIQDIAHGGTAGTTSANALSNLGAASSASPVFTGTSTFPNNTIIDNQGNVMIGTTTSQGNPFTVAMANGAGIRIQHIGSAAYITAIGESNTTLWFGNDAKISCFYINDHYLASNGNSGDVFIPIDAYGGGLPTYGFQGDITSGLYWLSLHKFSLRTSSVDNLIADASGYVEVPNRLAVGTTTPQTPLHVYGAGETTLATIGVNMPAGSITASTIFLSCNTTDGMQGGITGSGVPGVITFVTQTSAHLSQLSADSEIPKIGQVVELTGNVMESSLTQYLPTCRLCKTKESSAVYGIYLGSMSDNKSLEIAKSTKPTGDQLSFVIDGLAKIKEDYETFKSERLADISRAEKQFITVHTPPQDLTPVQTGIDIDGNPIMGIIPVKPYVLTQADKDFLYIAPSQSELSAMTPSINTILSQEFKVCNIGGGGTIPAIVSNANGNITYGDLLVSDGNGNCMRQNDTIIRSSTIGKACVSVDWAKEPAKTKLIGILGYSG